MAASLETLLLEQSAIHTASANALTGNVLVHYAPELTLAALVDLVESCLRDAETPGAGAQPRTPPPAPIDSNSASRLGVAGRALTRQLGRFEHKDRREKTTVAAPPGVSASFPARGSGSNDRPDSDSGPDWHCLTADEALSALETSRGGLTGLEADDRLRRYGSNRLKTVGGRSLARVIAEQFKSGPVALLAGSAVLSIATGGIGDALVILGVVIANAAIGAYAEHHAESTLTALTRFELAPAVTVRDAEARRTNVSQLVPGDVIALVLLEDGLDSLLTAVAEGRTIGDDIGKAVHFVVATNLSEVLVTLSAVALGLAVPLTPKQLLWINLLTDVFPELALAVDPAESDVLLRPPRASDARLVSSSQYSRIGGDAAIMTLTALTSYGVGLRRSGAGPLSSTMAFVTLTAAQLLHAIGARSAAVSLLTGRHLPPNRYMGAAVAGGVAIQLAAGVVGPVRRLLGAAPLAIGDAALAWGLAAVSFAATEALKLLRQHTQPGEIR